MIDTPAPRVEALFVYPVKSLGGISVQSAGVEGRGFHFDRRFMLVDHGGQMITQREENGLARVTTAIDGDTLILGGEVRVPLVPDPISGKGLRVTVWSDVVRAQPVDDEGYFSSLLSRSVRLVYMPTERRRRVDGRYATKGHIVSFADGFPFVLVGRGSMDKLADELGAALDVRRFRPNIVVAGMPAYGEDALGTFQLGDVAFRRVKPCSRCVIVDLDPDTGQSGGRVLKTLGKTRLRRRRMYFGQNLVGEGRGLVRVGDALIASPLLPLREQVERAPQGAAEVAARHGLGENVAFGTAGALHDDVGVGPHRRDDHRREREQAPGAEVDAGRETQQAGSVCLVFCSVRERHPGEPIGVRDLEGGAPIVG